MDVVSNMGESFRKYRWLWIGGLILIGGVFLFMMMRGGGGGASSGGGASGPSDQQLAINAELQARQMEIQGQLAVASMQVAAQDAAAERELTAMQLAANTQLQALELQLASDRYNTDALAELEASRISSQETILKMQEQNALARDQIAAELQQNLAQIQANTVMQVTTTQAEQAIAAINANTNLSMKQIDAMKEINLAGIYSNVEIQREMQRTARHGASTGLMGNIFGGILGLFSDVRLKKNIRDEGQREVGFFGANREGPNEYSYEYEALGPVGRHFGVMAQEAQRANPSAVYSHSGYLQVDYRRLGA